MNSRWRTWSSYLIVAVAAGLLSGLIPVGTESAEPVRAHVSDEASLDNVQGRALADQLSAVFEQASEAVGPSVVAIFSEQTVDVTSPFGPGSGDEFFRRFFGEPGQGMGGKQTVRGLGSGVIVSSDGYILTNNHVVEGASKLTVAIDYKTRLDAEVVGTDPQTDVAVIKVDGKDLPAARLGDSDSVRVGQWVIAVGNPFQLMHTVTSGIISAKGRSSVGLADYEDFIQTDASINPGNSGGALSDLDGNVIGINTAISTPSGGSVGIGFAIPINMARTVMDALISEGSVHRGYLGVMLQTIDENLARALGLESAEGVIVSDVTAGSPADEAGIRVGDVIQRVDGKPIGDTIAIRNTIAQAAPGSAVKIQVLRDGKRVDLVAKLGERPQQGTSATKGGDPREETTRDLGLEIQDLTPEIARQLGYERDRGALVTAVEPGSAADDAGLGRGDLILAVNQTPVSSAGELVEELRTFRSGDVIAMRVRRGSGTFYAALTMP